MSLRPREEHNPNKSANCPLCDRMHCRIQTYALQYTWLGLLLICVQKIKIMRKMRIEKTNLNCYEYHSPKSMNGIHEGKTWLFYPWWIVCYYATYLISLTVRDPTPSTPTMSFELPSFEVNGRFLTTTRILGGSAMDYKASIINFQLIELYFYNIVILWYYLTDFY